MTAGLYHTFIHTSAPTASHRSHLPWLFSSCDRKELCHPWIHRQCRWLSSRFLVFRRTETHHKLPSLLRSCCFAAVKGELIQPTAAPLWPKGGDACSALHRLLPWSSHWIKGGFLMCSTSQVILLAKSHLWLSLPKTCLKPPSPCSSAAGVWRGLWNSISTDLWACLTLIFKSIFILSF